MTSVRYWCGTFGTFICLASTRGAWVVQYSCMGAWMYPGPPCVVIIQCRPVSVNTCICIPTEQTLDQEQQGCALSPLVRVVYQLLNKWQVAFRPSPYLQGRGHLPILSAFVSAQLRLAILQHRHGGVVSRSRKVVVAVCMNLSDHCSRVSHSVHESTEQQQLKQLSALEMRVLAASAAMNSAPRRCFTHL